MSTTNSLLFVLKLMNSIIGRYIYLFTNTINVLTGLKTRDYSVLTVIIYYAYTINN